MEAEGAIVIVRDATKILSSKKVLSSFNMTVKSQSIYGLLGPSGSGKTTLLSCLLGLKKIDSGFIDVKIRKSRNVGYMPQENALFDNFTIEETFNFFGNFFEMKRKDTKDKMDYYLEFMGLQNYKNQAIGNCSGGEKRRVSFIIAFLHDPQLLILDEPTVGLDCLLSERIWQHLITLSNAGKTIIITTHYIQEAENCQMIGFMRSGRLLEEKPPEELMRSYQSTDLEEIFLELCKKLDDNRNMITNSEKVIDVGERCKLYPDNVWFSKYRFKALVMKNILCLKGNALETFGTLILPLLLSMIFASATVGDSKGLKLGLMSLELPDEVGIRACEDMNQIYVEELDCKIPEFLTCNILEELRMRGLIMIPYNNSEELARGVEKNHIWGSIEVQENFTTSFIKLVGEGLMSSALDLDKGFITSRIDGTHTLMKTLLIIQIKETIDALYETVLRTCGISEKNSLIPIKFNEPVYGQKKLALGESVLPDFICAFAFYFTVMFTTSTFMTEKTEGLSNRFSAGGTTHIEIVLAHIVIQFAIMFLQNIIMFVSMYVILSYQFRGDIMLAMLLVITVNLTGASYALLLAELSSTQTLALFAGIGASFLTITTSGLVWPAEGMNPLLYAVMKFTPVFAGCNALTNIITKNSNLLHQPVITGFLLNLGWTTILTMLSFVIHRLNK